MNPVIILLFACFCTCRPLFSQNVGINTTSPDRPLTIRAVSGNNELLTFRDTGNTSLWHVNMLNDGLNFVRTGIPGTMFTISSQGYAGIGMPAPQYPLDIYNFGQSAVLGNFRTESDFAYLSVSNFADTARIGVDPAGMLVGTLSNADLRLKTNNVNRIFISGGNGNVGIGMSNPTAKLHVNGNAVFEYEATFNSTVTINNTADMVFLRVDGAIASKSAGINIIGGPQTINPGNRSFLHITNTSATAAIVTLGNGVADGQVLYILTGSTGGGGIQFFDNAVNNTQLSSNYLMGVDDTLTLIWNTALGKWIELHRSVN